MTAAQVVGRGHVLVWDHVVSGRKVSAIVSKADAERMRKRFGGRVVNVAGQRFHYAQQRQLRVLDQPEAVL